MGDNEVVARSLISGFINIRICSSCLAVSLYSVADINDDVLLLWGSKEFSETCISVDFI